MVGWCRAFRWPPFFGKVGIHPIAKPRFFVSPTQALSDENLTDAATLHANAFDAVQVVYQPIQSPGRVALFSQVGRLTERSLNDLADQLRLIGHWPTRARGFLQSLLIEAMEPIAHQTFTDVELLGNLWRPLALAHQSDDLRPFELSNRCVARMHQERNGFFLLLS
jgi:hypothetical protein